MDSARRVLDTSALMSGRPFEGDLFTTEEVLRELRRQTALTPQLETFLSVKVRIASPSHERLAEIRGQAERTGDAPRLSPTDVGLLALAADLDAIIVTDDYSIQNLASVVGVEFETVLERGITEQVRWRYRCRGCGRFYDAWRDSCPVCGAPLKTTRTPAGAARDPT